MWHFGRDRFVAEVQAKTLAAGLADYSRENYGCRHEVQVPQLGCIPGIPENTRAGAALDVATFCVERKCGGATSDNSWDGQTLGLQLTPKRRDGRERSLAGSRAFIWLWLCQMTVVSVQATGSQSWQRRDEPVEFDGFFARWHARSMLTDI